MKTSKSIRAPNAPKCLVYSSKIKRSLSANSVCWPGNPPPPPAVRRGPTRTAVFNPYFSHSASPAWADQTRSHLAFPPPPVGVCPPSAVSSFSACIPGGQSVGRTNFRPVCPPLADLGPFRTQPAHPRLLPRPSVPPRPRSWSGTESQEARAVGARAAGAQQPSRAPRSSWKGSRLQLGNPLGGENPCQGIQLSGLSCKQKAQV